MSTDQGRVWAIISEFLARINKARDELDYDTQLYGHGLGLDSLEAAELSATLEDELGSDPWSADEEPPETIGDIVTFYERAATA